jgi:hypothetical protein
LFRAEQGSVATLDAVARAAEARFDQPSGGRLQRGVDRDERLAASACAPS